MRPPRRIFRSTGLPGLAITRFILAAGALSLAAMAIGGLSSDLFGHTAPGPERLSSGPAGVMVVDGETLRLGTQVLRLRGIEAPSRGDACRGGQDCGGAATSALARLVWDRRVDCRLAGRDPQGRLVAACEAGGLDLSRAIVASGWARAGAGVPELADVELHARRQGNGLWAGGAE